MNYNKLQLSFLLLLIMLILQLIVNLYLLKKTWLTFTSVIAITLCLSGLVYAVRKEHQ